MEMDVTRDTLTIHAGEQMIEGSVVMPIFQSSTYAKRYPDDSLRYHRLNNGPQHEMMHTKLAALEGTDDALTLASGMAAITTSLLALTEPGDHLLAQKALYGGVRHFLSGYFTHLGRQVSFFDPNQDDIASLVRPNTRGIYVEGLSNPMVRGMDFTGIVRQAKNFGLLSFIDNTFLSPMNFRPAALGFDIVLHSATKYLNGHCDIIAGVAAGSTAHIHRIRQLANDMGGCLDANSLFLLNRGLKTLGLRMRQHNVTAAYLAEAIQDLPQVAHVTYPSLPHHPEHAILKEHMSGFGGVFAFEHKGPTERLIASLERLRLFRLAPSLGGVESLICRPVDNSHANVSETERVALGITANTVRVAVGIEAPEDLFKDLRQALT